MDDGVNPRRDTPRSSRRLDSVCLKALYEETLAAVQQTFIVRYSAVVLSELRRGARTREAERLVANLFRLGGGVWEPIAADWWEAGRVIRKVGDTHGWGRDRRRDFQNDTLIALTARRHGAAVVTADRADFEILSREVGVSVLAV